MSQIIKNLAAGPVPPTVATQYTTDDGIAVPAANNLNVLGGAGVKTSGLGSTITIEAETGGFSWSETSTSIGVAAQTATFCNAALTISLPATASLVIGSTVIIYADTSAAVVIQANAGQFIEIGGSTSSAAGTATSNTQGSIVQLVFKPSDLTWHALSSVGTWTTA